MINKASAVGWVIEVRRPAPGLPNARPDENSYFNVATSDTGKATLAAVALAKKSGFDGEGKHVRALSQGEIDVLGLKAGEALPA